MKLVIAGIFYDGYSDIWEDFLELFNKYWPNCPYELYIINNEKKINFNGKINLKVIHAGKEAEYSKKIQTLLSSVKSEYYLLLLEDFFLGKTLNQDVLKDILNYIKKYEIKYYKMPIDDFIPVGSKNIIRNISLKDEYTITCQPSIWKRNFLIECIGNRNYNAWIFEGIYSKAPKVHSTNFLEGCIVDNRNILSIHHGALQGKLIRKTYNYFKKNGYKLKNKRHLLSLKEEKFYELKKLCSNIFPKYFRDKLKAQQKDNLILKKYEDEIEKLITEMNLDINEVESGKSI